MQFTNADLVQYFDPGTFARGEDYVRKGNVLSTARERDSIKGEARGSGGAVYRQSIQFKTRSGVQRLDGQCSCPVSYNCKHVVAVMLTALAQAEQAVASGVPADTDIWLQQVLAAVAGNAQVTPPRGLIKGVFVLIPDAHDQQPRLHLCSARLRKDRSIIGGWIDDARLFAHIRDPANTPREEETLRIFAGLVHGAHIDRDKPPMLTGMTGAALLKRLSADDALLWADSRDHLTRGKLRTIRPGPPRQAVLGWQAIDTTSDALRLHWRFDDGAHLAHVLPTDPVLYLSGDVLGELALSGPPLALPLADVLKLIAHAPALLPQQRAGLTDRLIEHGLEHILPLPQAPRRRKRKDVVPTGHLLLDSMETAAPPLQWRRVPASANSPEPAPVWHDYAVLSFDYDGIRVAPDSTAALRRLVGGVHETIIRNFAHEEALAHILTNLAFTRPARRSPVAAIAGSLELPTVEYWHDFAIHVVGSLEAMGWQLTEGDNYRYHLIEADDWYAELEEEGEGHAWFSLELGILVDGERHALLPLLLDALQMVPNQFALDDLTARFDGSDLVAQLPDGRKVVLPWERIKPMLTTLRDMHFKEEGEPGWRLPFTSLARLAELEQAAQMRWLGGDALRALGRKLHDFTGIAEAPLPGGLQATLRPYQHAGLSWMQFLREHGFGGILADDMGLGKTVQTLAHILAEKEAGRLDRPALVVAPTSLMGNWQSEAARFTPGLRVLLLHGKERAASFDNIAGADLVLTTYALLGRDEAALRQHQYHLLILDEAQYIKNSRAKMAQTACLLDARHRLCLTGTPVQNHLGELWSQFHFLMPGLLGDLKTFNAHYRRPIELGGDSSRQAMLTQRIKPFMLRRTKDKVATELPPKTEIMLPVTFDTAQRDLYETMRVAMHRKVREEIDRRGLARSQIVILDALLKLRQVCCDPRLLKKPASTAGSAKLDTLLELLDTLRSEGRKVLIFSQFTSMLALIGQALEARAIDYVQLTGDTVDRAAPIAAFQTGTVSVFLISLKAGGVGLNLTAADTVIHYDPWWNPASENQATDRAWRIGQTQPVFVYKLIAQGTLEEKIQEMQKKKGELASAVIDAKGALASGIDAADLQAIFAQPAM
jgi:superfamily II DNA or RNA helicase